MTHLPPKFVAYVYPGWHRDKYRPNVDEWKLLYEFDPRFPGHLPPPRPAQGTYDDTDPITASKQIKTAKAAGIQGFTYFAYWQSSEFVMGEPMKVAHELAGRAEWPFEVGATWCLRLPHDSFPVLGPEEPQFAVVDAIASVADRPIHQLTLRDFKELIANWDRSWLETELGQSVQRNWLSTPAGADTAGPQTDALVDGFPQGHMAVEAVADGTAQCPQPSCTSQHEGKPYITLRQLVDVLEDISELARDDRDTISDLQRILSFRNLSTLRTSTVLALLRVTQMLRRRSGTIEDLTPREAERIVQV